MIAATHASILIHYSECCYEALWIDLSRVLARRLERDFTIRTARSPACGDGRGTGRNDAIAQNAAIADNAVSSPGLKVYRTIHADVVAIDQPYVINRLGASQPEGMIFVLKNDLVAKTGNERRDFRQLQTPRR